MRKIYLTILAASVYVGAIVAANLFTSRFGLWSIGFGLLATAGTVWAGVAFVARDAVQETLGKRAVFAAIVVGAALSYAFGDGRIALASGLAFLLAELLDFAVYTPLRKRSFAVAIGASQFVGAVADTFLFLWIAGFPIATSIVAGQLVGKLLWPLMFALPLGVIVDLLRKSQHAKRA